MVHEGSSILRTLDLFKKTPTHAAVVIDEYGAAIGIVASIRSEPSGGRSCSGLTIYLTASS